MKTVLALLATFAFVFPSLPTMADSVVTVGEDRYVAAFNAELAQPSIRDAILLGFAVDVAENIAGDAMVLGFTIDVDGTTGGDLHAAGQSVDLRGPIGQDLSAAGAHVHVRRDATIGGNARIAGLNIVLDPVIGGSLAAAGANVVINGVVHGDVSLDAGALRFGPDARIDGTLSYAAPQPFEIDPAVIGGDRIIFTRLEGDGSSSMARTLSDQQRRLPSGEMLLAGFAATLLLFIVVGGALIAFAPGYTSELQHRTTSRPLRTALLGLLGVGAVVGLIPIAALTIVGIPLIPLVVLALVVLWLLGYAVGVLTIAWRVAVAIFNPEETAGNKIMALAIAVIVFVALNFIPIIGWLINLVLVLLGVGAMVDRQIDHTGRPTRGAASQGPLPEHHLV